jgi:hypothetical protein
MPFIILLIIIVIAVVWWLKSERSLSRNERLYLKRRGYEPGPTEPGPPVDADSKLVSLINSLGDISPYSRQRAAEELARLCQEGKRDLRMFESLVRALNDSEAAVRGAAAAALGQFGDSRAVAVLKEQLEVDESILFRAAALKALDKLNGDRKAS